MAQGVLESHSLNLLPDTALLHVQVSPSCRLAPCVYCAPPSEEGGGGVPHWALEDTSSTLKHDLMLLCFLYWPVAAARYPFTPEAVEQAGARELWCCNRKHLLH